MPIPLFSKPLNVRALALRFAVFPKMLPLFCVLRFLCCLGRICRVLVIVMFLGKFVLLTLSKLARKDCPFGNFTRCDIIRLRIKIFCLSISTAATSLFSTKYFFDYWSSYTP